MDPLSVSASLIGVITAAVQVSGLLKDFIDDVKSAPESARNVLREVVDISISLQQLQEFLLGKQVASRSRTSFIMVEQVVVVLTGCVMIFSELEQVLEVPKADKSMGIRDRLKWVTKEPAVLQVLGRLQASKASLNLMLTTLTWYATSSPWVILTGADMLFL